MLNRLVTFTKTLVVGAGVLTALSIAAISGLQFRCSFMTKTWCPYPVSRVFELAEIDVPIKYVLASESRRPGTPNFYELLLDLPAIVPLAAALTLLALFYAWLEHFETASRGP